MECLLSARLQSCLGLVEHLQTSPKQAAFSVPQQAVPICMIDDLPWPGCIACQSRSLRPPSSSCCQPVSVMLPPLYWLPPNPCSHKLLQAQHLSGCTCQSFHRCHLPTM